MKDPILNIVLVEPRIPPNTGNIARLCAATGCRLHLVEPLGFSLEDKYLKRAGLDYWEYVDVRRWTSFSSLKKQVKDRHFIFMSAKVNRPYTEADFREGDFLVFGNEPIGLPENLLQDNIDCVYTIPMWGRVRSLNLSNSVSIVVYEALRRIKGF